MNAYMALQFFQMHERFVTLFTIKMTISTVSLFMQLQGILMLETLFTDGT
jgi:hypothetical protein